MVERIRGAGKEGRERKEGREGGREGEREAGREREEGREKNRLCHLRQATLASLT